VEKIAIKKTIEKFTSSVVALHCFCTCAADLDQNNKSHFLAAKQNNFFFSVI
jgi:hypothetical protein